MAEATYQYSHPPPPPHHHPLSHIPDQRYAQVPHRKPVPGHQVSSSAHQYSRPQPFETYPPQHYTDIQSHSQQVYAPESYHHTHHYQSNPSSRSATMLAVAPPVLYTSRRTPSNATQSSMASSGNPPRASMSSQADLRRSTSSRSGTVTEPTSYVALMRKQKATVWCDRAQHEDPRLIAQQRINKQRAAIEVLGGNKRTVTGRSNATASGNIVGSNKVTARIRYHGKAGLVGYTGQENYGIGVGGVPMRLSASEVEGEDNEDSNSQREGTTHHRRTGSGRSSLGSGRRGLTYRQSGASANSSGRWSSGNTPPDSLSEVREDKETPVPFDHPRHASSSSIQQDYFHTQGKPGVSRADSAGSGASGSSGGSEKRDEVAGLEVRDNAAARLAGRSLLANTNLVAREKSVRDPEGLRRRGSIDERTHTMSAGRLFVANPDSDSD